MNYEYISEPERAAEVARQILNEEKAAGLDAETTGLDPHKDKVTIISLSTRKKNYVIDNRDGRCLPALRPMLEEENLKKIGFNEIFDYCMIKGTAGIDTEGCVDIMLGEQVLMSGLDPYCNLEGVTLKYLQKQRDKSLQKSFVNHQGAFSEAQLQYAADDVADLFPIADRLKAEIQKAGLIPTWAIENNALAAFGDCYFYGQKIDVPGWKKIMELNKDNLRKSVGELDKYFGQVYGQREVQEGFGEILGANYDPLAQYNYSTVDINYNAPAQILYGLQMMGVQVDGETIKSTGKEIQKKLQHLPQFVALTQYRQAKRRIDAYGQNFLDAINPATGKIHPQLWQIGTGTGRPAGKEGLNILNIPREVYFRHAFISEDDRLISTVDYSGAELRIMAERSGDELMVRGYNSGVDFHCFVVGLLFNKENVSKKDPLRQPVKTINFGLAYGMGPGRLCASLNGEGYKISFDESKELFDKYKSTFKGAIRWLDDLKLIARTRFEMRNCNGRRRRWNPPDMQKIKAQVWAELDKKAKGQKLPEGIEFRVTNEARERYQDRMAGIEREGANCVVQSENVDWTKPSMYEIRKECKKRKYDAYFINTVYDETVLNSHKSCAQEVHELQKKIMIDCGNRFMKKVPVEVEGHLEPYWTK